MSATLSPGAPTLILIPTSLELKRIQGLGGLATGSGLIELCGFGPVASAARSAELIARYDPRRVLLLGCAGTHAPESHPVGAALCFDSVALDGVGSGEGSSFAGPGAMGLPQWEDPEQSVMDCLPLAKGDSGLLLTVCAAAGDATQAEQRRARFPEAKAEDMEAFGVALACHLRGVPLTVIRGISNVAGERDKRHWQLEAALTSALALAQEVL